MRPGSGEHIGLHRAPAAGLISTRIFMILGAVFTCGYYAMPWAGFDRATQNSAFTAVSVTATVAVFTGIARHRPARPLPWLLLGAGQLSCTIADVVYSVLFRSSGGDPPLPNASDVLHLPQYPLLISALVVFIYRRTPQWHVVALLDAIIVSTGFALVWWVDLLGPIAGTDDISTVENGLAVAYSALDLLLLVLALQLVIGVATRTSAFRLLIGSLALVLVADVLFALRETGTGHSDGGRVDALWMWSYLLLGASALHPSMHLLDKPALAWPSLSRSRLASLAFAVALPLAVAVDQSLRGVPTDTPVLAAGTAVMVALLMIRLINWANAQQELAITDGLTGLYAPAFLTEWLRVECARAQHHGRELGVLLADVDNFRLVNTAYGHTAGNRALRELAERVRAACGADDVAGRYRADQFLIVLPDQTWPQVRAVAERIRQAVSGALILVDEENAVRVTVSIGAAALPYDGVGAGALIRVAESARDGAKWSGRNRVHCRRDPVVVLPELPAAP